VQLGDVPVTSADIQALMDDVGFRQDTPLNEGVRRFVGWYRVYYHV